MSDLTIKTNIPSYNTFYTSIDDRSPLQSPRAKSPINKCPNAPKKLDTPVPITPRVNNENEVSRVLFR